MSAVEKDSDDVMAEIKQQLAEHAILLYMKGSPDRPQCGFSAKAVGLLQECDVERIPYVDILQNPEIRSALKEYSNWPTYPQLYVKGELVGGVDIMQEMFDSGELQTLLNDVQK